MTSWVVRTPRGTASTLHQLDPPESVEPEIWIHQLTGPALVLGSTQSDDVVDHEAAAAAGIEVCRRRTGGGLVSLAPGDCWIDVVLPATSPLWDPDVGRAFWWLGQVWADALRTCLDSRPGLVEVHRGPLTGGDAGRLICFAGLGPGEVTVGGRKVVGLSQRRWRTGVKLQCLVATRWEPESIARFVNREALVAAGVELDHLPIGLAEGHVGPDSGQLTRTFLDLLPPPVAGTGHGDVARPASGRP